MNVCSGEPHTIDELAAALAAAVGGPPPVVVGGARPGDARHIVADPAKAAAVLGLRAATTFAEGIARFAHAPMRNPVSRADVTTVRPGSSGVSHDRVVPGHPEIVLPCLDEADALPGVLAALPDGWPVLVADNGSTDGTGAVASACGARVVVEPRRGYGAAVHAGLLAARADVVAVLDGDGSLDPAVLPAMADEVLAGRADLAVGRRVPTSVGVWPWHARAGNVVIAAMLRRRGVPVHDIAPMRVARRQSLLDLQIADRASGYPLEMLLRAGAAGWRIVELPVLYRARAGGRSKVSGSALGSLRAARDMAGLLR